MPSSLMARVKAGNSSASADKCPSHVDVSPVTQRSSKDCTSRTHAGCEAEPEPKSIIRQLLSHNPGPSSFEAPPPFYMCCESEAIDRQNCFELSPFECSAVQNPTNRDSATPQNFSRDPVDATSDPNEIPLECTPTPKKSSLAAAAFSSPATHRIKPTPTSSYYSKQPAVKSAYVPPFKRNALNVKEVTSPATPAKPVNCRNSDANTSHETPKLTLSTAKNAGRTRPSFHPQLVIKKYRRSAAGGGVHEEASVRSLEQLNATVNYLMQLFARQRPPNCENGMNNAMISNNFAGEDTWGKDDTASDYYQQEPSTQGVNPRPQASLCDTVNFIDDRLRAVQKDLVSLVGNLEESFSETTHDANNTLGNVQTKELLRRMQAKMVRYNILTLYLLSGVPSSKYQVKFGSRALRTCLSSYLNLSWGLHDDYSNLHLRKEMNNNLDKENAFSIELRTQDEMMAYVALFHMSAVLRAEENALPLPSTSSAEASTSLMEESGSGWGALFSTFTKYSIAQDGHSLSSVNKYPRWKWALELASLVQCGNYQRYFTLLEEGPSYQSADSTSSATLETSSEAASYNARFLLLARCCASHSINLIRLSALRQCNHAFGKGEKVPVRNLSRLLRFHPSNASDDEVDSASKHVLEFCRDAGLPVIDNDDRDRNVCFVLMKSAPIEISGDESIGRMCTPGRSNDSFVFGTEFVEQKDESVSSLTNLLHRVNMSEEVDDWEEHYCDDSSLSPNSDQAVMVRIDDDQVMIPSSNVLSKLVE
ncbi:hypothetical protein HJC23_002721 [Cyclotella cryptica]|uniref:SAC3/GANP/THP3 conserved domain-containing protein n=1 Tax=Cyclotella cryptica TaxID=29204 RepID=A0ABD3PDK6_9STRA